jgi:hypothetical protein
MALCPPYSQSNDGYMALITIYRKLATLPKKYMRVNA